MNKELLKKLDEYKPIIDIIELLDKAFSVEFTIETSEELDSKVRIYRKFDTGEVIDLVLSLDVLKFNWINNRFSYDVLEEYLQKEANSIL